MMKIMTRLVFAAAALVSLLIGFFWLWFLYEHGRRGLSAGATGNEQAVLGYSLLAGFWFLLALAFFVYYLRIRR